MSRRSGPEGECVTGQGQAAGSEHRRAPEQLLLCKELPVRNTEVQACLGGSLGFLIAQFLSSVSFSPPPLEYTRVFGFVFPPSQERVRKQGPGLPALRQHLLMGFGLCWWCTGRSCSSPCRNVVEHWTVLWEVVSQDRDQRSCRGPPGAGRDSRLFTPSPPSDRACDSAAPGQRPPCS